MLALYSCVVCLHLYKLSGVIAPFSNADTMSMDESQSPCGTCLVAVTWTCDGILCRKCDDWFHANCQHLTTAEYRQLSSPGNEDDWFCDNCLLKIYEDNNSLTEPTLTAPAIDKNWSRKAKQANIGTLNIRGLKTEKIADTKKSQIAQDMETYKLHVLAIQETHLSENVTETITPRNSRTKFTLFHSTVNRDNSQNSNKKKAGVGFVVRENIRAKFTPISDRICLVKIKHRNRYIAIINAYAPTQPVSEKNPEIREKFYDELESVMRTISNRDQLIVTGDFNAKTGSAYKDYPENMGAFGKGTVNSNGIELLDLANRHDMILSNTIFKHKLAHITTWESPARQIGSIRRNPYRNQIDYILTKTKDKHSIIDCRSHNGIETYTDHRLVKLTLNIKPTTASKIKTNRPLNLDHLKDKITRDKYAFNLEMKIMDKEHQNNNMSVQEQWDMIVDSSQKAAEEVLGFRTGKKFDNQEISQLSEKQKNLYQKFNSISDPGKRDQLRSERNQVINHIHKLVRKEKEQAIEREIQDIENTKDDSNRMYKAVRNLQRMKKKEPLLIKTEDGLTTDTDEQVKVISEFFKQMFTSAEACEIEAIPPTPMTIPFTEQEIHKAVKSLKNGKSPGIDNITAEQLKSGPAVVNRLIADILNTIAATGDFPEDTCVAY